MIGKNQSVGMATFTEGCVAKEDPLCVGAGHGGRGRERPHRGCRTSFAFEWAVTSEQPCGALEVGLMMCSAHLV